MVAIETPTRRWPMSCIAQVPGRTAIHDEHDAVCVSLELSRSRWLVTALSPGSEKMSTFNVKGGDGAGLLALLAHLKVKAEARASHPIDLVVIQEAGLDGFWIHRLLEGKGPGSNLRCFFACNFNALRWMRFRPIRCDVSACALRRTRRPGSARRAHGRATGPARRGQRQ